MCVTHGLTSVNPKKHLIGHHMDWARGFPFEAFGLPDQYERPAPSVALFGFGYDDDFLKVLGEPWPGVREAEARPGARGRAAGTRRGGRAPRAAGRSTTAGSRNRRRGRRQDGRTAAAGGRRRARSRP